MKVLILAGGLGTRLGEETSVRPKPMVSIGNRPVLWHIMKIYSHYGFNDFIVLAGYKQEIIKEYFLNYYANNSNVTIDLASNSVFFHESYTESFKITILDTGANTLTAGRIKQAQDFVGNERFMLTYGDGVGDIDIKALISCHEQSGKLCTLTAYQSEERFGVLSIKEDGSINSFKEKKRNDAAWINAGFFVCEPDVFNYIPADSNMMWEQFPLNKMSSDGQLNAYKHAGFWHPMDMLKDKEKLNKLWNEGKACWKVWTD